MCSVALFTIMCSSYGVLVLVRVLSTICMCGHMCSRWWCTEGSARPLHCCGYDGGEGGEEGNGGKEQEHQADAAVRTLLYCLCGRGEGRRRHCLCLKKGGEEEDKEEEEGG